MQILVRCLPLFCILATSCTGAGEYTWWHRPDNSYEVYCNGGTVVIPCTGPGKDYTYELIGDGPRPGLIFTTSSLRVRIIGGTVTCGGFTETIPAGGTVVVNRDGSMETHFPKR